MTDTAPAAPTDADIAAAIRALSPTQQRILVATERNAAAGRRPSRPTRDAMIRVGVVERSTTGALVLTTLGDAVGAALVAAEDAATAAPAPAPAPDVPAPVDLDDMTAEAVLATRFRVTATDHAGHEGVPVDVFHGYAILEIDGVRAGFTGDELTVVGSAAPDLDAAAAIDALAAVIGLPAMHTHLNQAEGALRIDQGGTLTDRQAGEFAVLRAEVRRRIDARAAVAQAERAARSDRLYAAAVNH